MTRVLFVIPDAQFDIRERQHTMNSNTVKDSGAKLMNLAHRFVLTVSGRRLLAKPFGMPLVELHTIGRKSGLPRSCYLTTPVHDSQRVVLVASKGGDDRDPDWYRNLQSHPDAELVIDGERRKVHARTANVEEKADLWPKIVAAYQGYANYQTRTSRDIPVVICEFQV
jgi:deazaflavin-dependent oxidoreductase (nitroreductase family)